MKILSYNIFGTKEPKGSIPKWEIRQQNIKGNIPKWETRQKNIKRILNQVLSDQEIKICCFQEVNENNIDLLNDILIQNNFKMLKQFPMKTCSCTQYNIVAVKNESVIQIDFIACIPHGSDDEYKEIDSQVIDYNMSDYRTTVFVSIHYHNRQYLIGNIHTDYISVEGKIRGTIKSLAYLDKIPADYKMIVGDMNMICHMSEAYIIKKENEKYTTLSRNKNFNIMDQSWHGYGLKEQVNSDFAFVEKIKEEDYDYEIIKQNNIQDEGSDHRPIIITIKE